MECVLFDINFNTIQIKFNLIINFIKMFESQLENLTHIINQLGACTECVLLNVVWYEMLRITVNVNGSQ